VGAEAGATETAQASPAGSAPSEPAATATPLVAEQPVAAQPAAGPPVAESAAAEPSDPNELAALQVTRTLAQAMRFDDPGVFAENVGQLVTIIADGGWDAPMLATHLVHLMVGGVPVGRTPADKLAWRLSHLPNTSEACQCSACRSWRVVVAQSARPEAPRDGADQDQAGPALPGVEEIERAAAIGAEQAARLARAMAS
jgi:hypothetical protein